MKKLIKNSIIITMTILCITKINSLANKEEVYTTPQKNTAIALNYHRVRERNIWNRGVELITQSKELTTYSVYKDTFEAQMDKLIEEGAYFATPEELEEFRKKGEYPDKCVWISFDDIDKSVYEVAFPILKERNIPFTLFVISSKVGDPNFNNLEMATWDDLRDMRDSGLATFGSHTHDMHYLEDDKAIFLDKSNYDEFEKDIKLSKKTIKEQLNIDVNSIAYPFGETSDAVTEIARKSGFEYAYILSPFPISANDSKYHQNRYLIHKDNFEKIMNPWFDEYKNK